MTYLLIYIYSGATEGQTHSIKMSDIFPAPRQWDSSTTGLRKQAPRVSWSIHQTTGLLHTLLLLAKDKGTGITSSNDSGLLQPGSLGEGAAESFRWRPHQWFRVSLTEEKEKLLTNRRFSVEGDKGQGQHSDHLAAAGRCQGVLVRAEPEHTMWHADHTKFQTPVSAQPQPGP